MPAPQAKTETVAASAPSPGDATAEAAARAEAEPGKTLASAPAPLATAPTTSAPVVLKRVDQTALAASIAKEVTKSLLPPPVLVAIGFVIGALTVWLIMRH